MAQSEILVSYKKRSFIHSLPSSISEIKKVASLKFSLESSTIIIQIFNNSWKEYIDILEDHELTPGSKYRILALPSILYVESSPGPVENIYSFAPQELDTISTFSQRSLVSPDSQDVATVQELPSSVNFSNSLVAQNDIHFSSSLREALQGEVTLSRVLRSELVSAYVKAITVDTVYPSSIMVTDAAREIIRDFPYLKESIGTGYGGWRQAIRDKLKNLRRFDTSEEVKRKKKIKKVPELQSSQRNIETIVVKCDLSESFVDRREEIVQNKLKVKDLKMKFPNLFQKLEFEKEFCRITEKSGLFTYISKFLNRYCENLNILTRTKQKLPAWAKSIENILDGTEKNLQVVKELLAVLMLPIHFYEEQLALIYPSTVTENFVEDGPASPHIAIVGLETNHPNFYVFAERELVLQLGNISEALATLLASYFIFRCEYPKSWKKTLLFLESFALELYDVNKYNMPPQIISFVQKLKNITV